MCPVNPYCFDIEQEYWVTNQLISVTITWLSHVRSITIKLEKKPVMIFSEINEVTSFRSMGILLTSYLLYCLSFLHISFCFCFWKNFYLSKSLMFVWNSSLYNDISDKYIRDVGDTGWGWGMAVAVIGFPLQSAKHIGILFWEKRKHIYMQNLILTPYAMRTPPGFKYTLHPANKPWRQNYTYRRLPQFIAHIEAYFCVLLWKYLC